MNNLTTTPFGAAEHCALDNWAAEYAKKLFVAEAAQRTEDVTAEAQARAAADTAIENAYKAADTAEAQARAAADTELDGRKVDKTQYASTTQAGVIKLLKNGANGNNSGLMVDEADGVCYVACDSDFGTSRTGGRVATAAATEAEIEAGTNAYKPIVPKTLSAAVEKVTGKRSELVTSDKTSFTAAVNELNGRIDSITTMDIYSTEPVRVGTWIDGTPVWRVAYPITSVTEIGCTDPEKAWSVGIDDILLTTGIIKICEHNLVKYIADGLVFQNDASYDPVAFGCNINHRYAGIYSFSTDNLDPVTHFFGWIDFATPASNLYNPYTDPDSAVDMTPGQDEGGEVIGDEPAV